MIKIDNEYIINADDNSYKLEIKGQIKDENSKNYGKEVTTTYGYYSTLESALIGYIKAKTRKYISKETENTLDELLTEIKKYKQEIQDKIKNI